MSEHLTLYFHMAFMLSAVINSRSLRSTCNCSQLGTCSAQSRNSVMLSHYFAPCHLSVSCIHTQHPCTMHAHAQHPCTMHAPLHRPHACLPSMHTSPSVWTAVRVQGLCTAPCGPRLLPQGVDSSDGPGAVHRPLFTHTAAPGAAGLEPVHSSWALTAVHTPGQQCG